jgi:hypothetical protein
VVAVADEAVVLDDVVLMIRHLIVDAVAVDVEVAMDHESLFLMKILQPYKLSWISLMKVKNQAMKLW